MIKNIFSLCSLLFFSFYSCQNLKGVYQSKNGSILELKKDHSYTYVKQNVFSHLVDTELLSQGVFEVKKNILILKNKSAEEKIDKISIKEIDINSTRKDSIKVNLHTNTKQFKVFVCDTGLELLKKDNDYSGCYPLNEGLNKISKIYPEKFHFRIFPNIEEYSFRMNFDKINRLYFVSRDFTKRLNTDLDINIEFDPRNFLNSSNEEEIAIIKEKTIRFLGEDLVLQK